LQQTFHWIYVIYINLLLPSHRRHRHRRRHHHRRHRHRRHRRRRHHRRRPLLPSSIVANKSF